MITRRATAFRAAVLPDHYAFLEELRQSRKLETAGPFGDGSGGAYVVSAGDLDEALAIASSDPLRSTGCSTVEVHEWNAR
ncbi:MAG TPA: YciI family protein [Sphingomonas sp.]|nr:YciI family protein [Sphingomonas sp.]